MALTGVSAHTYRRRPCFAGLSETPRGHEFRRNPFFCYCRSLLGRLGVHERYLDASETRLSPLGPELLRRALGGDAAALAKVGRFILEKLGDFASAASIWSRPSLLALRLKTWPWKIGRASCRERV